VERPWEGTTMGTGFPTPDQPSDNRGLGQHLYHNLMRPHTWTAPLNSSKFLCHTNHGRSCFLSFEVMKFQVNLACSNRELVLKLWHPFSVHHTLDQTFVRRIQVVICYQTETQSIKINIHTALLIYVSRWTSQGWWDGSSGRVPA
jgi:hypothetical protein